MPATSAFLPLSTGREIDGVTTESPDECSETAGGAVARVFARFPYRRRMCGEERKGALALLFHRQCGPLGLLLKRRERHGLAVLDLHVRRNGQGHGIRVAAADHTRKGPYETPYVARR